MKENRRVLVLIVFCAMSINLFAKPIKFIVDNRSNFTFSNLQIDRRKDGSQYFPVSKSKIPAQSVVTIEVDISDDYPYYYLAATPDPNHLPHYLDDRDIIGEIKDDCGVYSGVTILDHPAFKSGYSSLSSAVDSLVGGNVQFSSNMGKQILKIANESPSDSFAFQDLIKISLRYMVTHSDPLEVCAYEPTDPYYYKRATRIFYNLAKRIAKDYKAAKLEHHMLPEHALPTFISSFSPDLVNLEIINKSGSSESVAHLVGDELDKLNSSSASSSNK